jgi:tetratricopeptide (TPR) repeat protein
VAIAIEGFSVVALKSRIEEQFPGGLAALSQKVPNATELSDDDLWRCAFMAAGDAKRFLAQLQEAGLNTKQGPDPDVVTISEFDLSVEPYCEWIRTVRWDKGVVAWRAGTTPRSVVARQGWSPESGSGLTLSHVNDDHLEFRRLEGNVAVYFDKQQGCEVYLGRTAADPDEVFKASAKIVFDHAVDPGQPALQGEPYAKVAHAIAELERIASQFPNSWNVHFMIGKGKLALGETDLAYQSLRRANELEADSESAYRELAGVCLMLGRAEEAIAIGEKAAALKPDNPETLGNLACAYLIGGRLAEALPTINAALKLDEDDLTNRALQRRIHEVMKGTRPQPRKLGDLMN